MGELIATEHYLPTMPDEALAKVRALEAEIERAPQVEIAIDDWLHAGVYARTAYLPAGIVMTGAEIKCATLLMITGDVIVFRGSDAVRLSGSHTIKAEAGRKSVFVAHADTTITMIFATNAATVEEAENEFTNEAHRLQSRKAMGD